jgi:hypothetical protein
MSTVDTEHIISRALQNKHFIWYLNRFISGTVEWKSIADKCIGQDNAYCLSLIKSKCWTDKTATGGSWNERLESLIFERLSLGITHSDLLLKKQLGNWGAIILKIDPSNVSPFVVKMLTLIDNIYKDMLEMYGIKYRFVTAGELKDLDEDCLYINHNRITWNCGPINFKRVCKMHVLSDTPFTPLGEFMTKHECVNACFMLWEYLLNDEFTVPNCGVLLAEPEHLEENYMFIDHVSKG